MNNLAIIPARSGSKGLKDKNIKNLNWIPLIGFSIDAAKKSNSFTDVMVSTDSRLLADISKKAVEKARTQASLLFDCDPDEVVFTSGASESNNFILKEVADIQIENKNHIIK